MSINCPKCQTDNPDSSHFCSDCGTQLTPPKDIPAHTRTLEIPTEELTSGSTFAGRYQIVEELGRGGMGRVYRALDKQLNEEVALKLIKPEITSDEKTVQRFNNELKIARKISHKNVGKMFDLNEDEGKKYITMEYVPGEDLKSFIRRSGQLTVGKSLDITKQICEGLAEAHRLGIVHRDLKPSNIMIDRDGNSRIMDFGIARSVEGKGITGAGVMIGTPEYMSPEQVEGKDIDPRTDIYSLGIILYEMLTGKTPFEGDTAISVVVKHKTEAPIAPKVFSDQISEDLNAAILRCLEKDREKRYQSAQELRSVLETIEKEFPTTDRTIAERKPLTSREITLQLSPKKLLIPAIVLIAIIAIGVTIWQLLPEKKAAIAAKIENSIAVISFENQTGDQSYDYMQKAIPNLLITNLEQTGNLYVVTWERMRDLLKQIDKGDIDVINADLGFEICRMEGIQAIILGSFVKAGDTFATDVKVLDVDSKRLIKSANASGKGEDSILDSQIDELSREISQGISTGSKKIEPTRVKVAEVTTTSMEAYNYFLQGREAYDKFYFEEARQHLEQSIDLDPNLAMAYYYLARVYHYLGDNKARINALEKAKLNSQRASEKEKLYIEAYYASEIEKNSQKKLGILKELEKEYPREKRIYFELGKYYQRDPNKLDRAIEELQKALDLDPNYGEAMNNLAYAYSNLGNFEKAIEYFEKYASIFPEDVNPLDSMGEIYMRMGKLDESLAKYKQVLKIKPDFWLSYLNLSYIYGLKEDYVEAVKWTEQEIKIAPSPGMKSFGFWWKCFFLFWQGRYEQSFNDLKKSLNLAKVIKNEEYEAWIEFLNGYVLYAQGELEQSRIRFTKWMEFITEDDPPLKPDNTIFHSFNVGLIELAQNNIDSARNELSRMKSLLPEIDPSNKKQLQFMYSVMQAEILLAEGSIEKAIAVMEEANPVGRPPMIQFILMYNLPIIKDVLARAYEKNGSIDEAIREYERLVTFDPSTEERCLIHPIYRYRLAKLYEMKDWKGKAIEQYEKFLDIYKAADPGVTEVSDAKKRLAELK